MTENIEKLKAELIEAVVELYVQQARGDKFKKDLEAKFEPVAADLKAAMAKVEALQEKLLKKVKKHVAPELVNETEAAE